MSRWFKQSTRKDDRTATVTEDLVPADDVAKKSVPSRSDGKSKADPSEAKGRDIKTKDSKTAGEKIKGFFRRKGSKATPIPSTSNDFQTQDDEQQAELGFKYRSTGSQQEAKVRRCTGLACHHSQVVINQPAPRLKCIVP